MTADADHGSDMAGQTGWQILAPLIDLVTPMAVRVAATLRLADTMRDGPVGIDELARQVGADPDALARLLRHLVARGMFSQPLPGVFGANATAALLDSAHPSGMQVSLDLSGFGGQMDLVFTELLHTVTTGEPAWQRKYGAPYWEYLAADPVMSASFDQAMSAGAEYVRDDLASYDWSTAEHVVDVGGGTGAFVAALLHEHAQLHITLVDLPATVERARTYLGDQGLDSRVDFAAQSFFDPLPGGGDVYVLNSVIHDWPDDAAAAILRRCAEAAGPKGRVLMIEEEHDTENSSYAEMDLRMLVLCGGRERSLTEYTRLAGKAGLTVRHLETTPLGQVGIECTPSARAVNPRPFQSA